MLILNSSESLGRFIMTRINEEVFAVQAGINCTFFISTSVVQELGLSLRSRDTSIVIEVENKKVVMVTAGESFLEEDPVLGTHFLYLSDCWS